MTIPPQFMKKPEPGAPASPEPEADAVAANLSAAKPKPSNMKQAVKRGAMVGKPTQPFGF